jgi:uncharacterized repeat protein (TIGR03803 family)
MRSLILAITAKAGLPRSRQLTCMIATTLLSTLLIAPHLCAQSNAVQGFSYKVLYTFTGGTDGGYPYSDLIEDGQGNLYGTTNLGGDSTCNCGTVFKLDLSGNLTTLHPFTGSPDGSFPLAGVTGDGNGNLYGTTGGGGQSIFGTVFTINQDLQESILLSFLDSPPADGNGPYYGGLFRDTDGSLYGTTSAGGDLSKCNNGGCGEIFKLDPSDQLTVLYKFQGTDGSFPVGRLVRDTNGNFYGTTYQGGAFGSGAVYTLDPSGNETVLYSFTGGTDGSNPYDGVILDAAGNLYGTAGHGGISGCYGPGCGVVFKIDPHGNESTLYSFTGGPDGGWPYGALILDPQGNLYGTTNTGGNETQWGVVFKLNPAGTETVLYTFNGEADGGGPFATGMVRDHNGSLYGMTQNGGDLSCPSGGGLGCGVIFKIAACHTATCHGEDDADTASAMTDPATVVHSTAANHGFVRTPH